MIQQGSKLFFFDFYVTIFVTFLFLLVSYIYPNSVSAAANPLGTYWQTEPSYPIQLASHVSLVKGNYIYVLGGGTDHSFNTVYMAETDESGINNQGWRKQANLPSTQQFHSGIIVDDNIYTFGGSPNGFVWFNKVFHAKIEDTGDIIAWSETTSLPKNLKLGGVTEYNGYIYYFGGTVGNTVHDEIYRAQIDPTDGSLSSWEIVGNVPDVTLGAFRLMRDSNQVYLYHGKYEDEIGNNTYKATIQYDGTITDWVTLPNSSFTLRRPYYYEGLSIFIILGGSKKTLSGPNIFTDEIYYIQKSNLNQNQWSLSPIKLPEPNCCGDQAVVSNGRLYVTAGFNGSYLNAVYSISINDTLRAPLNLPISYQGRMDDTQEAESNFRETFWNRLNSSFDHQFEEGVFENYQGESFLTDECVDGLSCYDGHAGIDFSRFINSELGTNEDTNVYPAATGEVVYRSERVAPHGKSPVRCKPDPKGFGCIAILKHDIEEYPNLYTLYAHLYEIYPSTGDTVDESTLLAQMGATGRATGRHLHFSVFEGDPSNNFGLNAFKTMKISDWVSLSNQIALEPSPSYCTYTAPNGFVFHPVDPSGWEGEGTDPWIAACGKENKLLWRYPLTQ